ncbi:hypothetical protein [Vibrio sonorensis]|uniref:hypothetical protein n=1 Tax=Vibrio sonorensis TaxID=1004316 RepID=UPI0008DA4B9A|nr:hypothetical protein [Vibrio sonorensis]
MYFPTSEYVSNSSETKKKINANGELEEIADVTESGIYTLPNCLEGEFDPNNYLLHAQATPDKAYMDLPENLSARCFPPNLSSFGFNIFYTGIGSLLTKTNELWGVGNPRQGFGGHGEMRINVPIKYADNIKTHTMLGASSTYPYMNKVLDNEGNVWHAYSRPRDVNGDFVFGTSEEAKSENGGTSAWVKYPSLDGETIVNLRLIHTKIGIGTPLVVTTSGKYYMLGDPNNTLSRDDAEANNLRVDEVVLPSEARVEMLIVVSYHSNEDVYRSAYLDQDGSIYSNQLEGMSEHKKVTHYYDYSDLKSDATIVDDGTGNWSLSLEKSKTADTFPSDQAKALPNDITFEWISNISYNFGDALFKGSDGEYYVLGGKNRYSMLLSGIYLDTWSLLYKDFANQQLANDTDTNYDPDYVIDDDKVGLKLIRLTDDLDYIKFLKDNPNWEFSRHLPLILVNKVSSEMAFIGGVGNDPALDPGYGAQGYQNIGHLHRSG